MRTTIHYRNAPASMADTWPDLMPSFEPDSKELVLIDKDCNVRLDDAIQFKEVKRIVVDFDDDDG